MNKFNINNKSFIEIDQIECEEMFNIGYGIYLYSVESQRLYKADICKYGQIEDFNEVLLTFKLINGEDVLFLKEV